MSISDIANATLNIERGVRRQSAIGGTKYDFSSPTLVAEDVLFSIQSASPTTIQQWAQRGVSVSHKAYTETNLVGVAQQGDRIPDTRFTPTRYYDVAFVEDMGGQARAFAVFCNLTT